ncbi:hypothetical protein CIB48_g10880 [Xylaria polymorpha]|nr:hypothetical protein CIB48_g10880 [Xylaria polymorpha]
MAMPRIENSTIVVANSSSATSLITGLTNQSLQLNIEDMNGGECLEGEEGCVVAYGKCRGRDVKACKRCTAYFATQQLPITRLKPGAYAWQPSAQTYSLPARHTASEDHNYWSAIITGLAETHRETHAGSYYGLRSEAERPGARTPRLSIKEGQEEGLHWETE